MLVQGQALKKYSSEENMDEIRELKADNKKLIIKIVLSVLFYALGISFFVMDMDLSMKIIFGLLFCGLPFTIGYNTRKMDKLAKKAQAKGVSVVVVKKKKKGLLKRILISIAGLAAGIVATPYLVVKYVIAIVNNSKRVKALQGGTGQPMYGADGQPVQGAQPMYGADGQPVQQYPGTDMQSQQAAWMQQMQEEKQRETKRRQISRIIPIVMAMIMVIGMVLALFMPGWITDWQEKKESEATEKAIAAIYADSSAASKIAIGMSAGDVGSVLSYTDKVGNTNKLEAAETVAVDKFGNQNFELEYTTDAVVYKYYSTEHKALIDEIVGIVGNDWRSSIDEYFSTDEASMAKLAEFMAGTHTEIEVTFVDDKVSKVVYDKAAPNVGEERASRQLKDYKVIKAYFSDDLPEAYVEYAATFEDGSYIRAQYAAMCEKPAQGGIEVNWTDEFGARYTAEVSGDDTIPFVLTSGDNKSMKFSRVSGTVYLLAGSMDTEDLITWSKKNVMTKIVLGDGTGVYGIGHNAAGALVRVEEVIAADDADFGDFAELFDESPFYNNDDNWEDGGLYFGDKLVAAKATDGELTVKDGTAIICQGACYNQEIIKLTLPESLTTIEHIEIDEDTEIIFKGTEEQWESVYNNNDRFTNVTFLK